MHDLTDEQWAALLEAWGGCAYCGAPALAAPEGLRPAHLARRPLHARQRRPRLPFLQRQQVQRRGHRLAAPQEARRAGVPGAAPRTLLATPRRAVRHRTGHCVSRAVPARDRERMPMHANDQEWLVSWHGPDDEPAGTPHGAAGVCVGPEGELVLVSADGRRWETPAGRPEDEETLEDTLRRELREEACVEVLAARLLGYTRGKCVQGHEQGLVLVRSIWRADVSDPGLGAEARDRAPAGRARRAGRTLRPLRRRGHDADPPACPGRGGHGP